MSRLLGMCFDWRVLGGLAIVGLGLWLYAPQLLGAALPILVVLICPLSMVLMAWMMRGFMGTAATRPSATDRLAALEQQQARLSAEIARTHSELASASRSAERGEG